MYNNLFKKIPKNYNEYYNIILVLMSIVFIIIYSSLTSDNRNYLAHMLSRDMSLYISILLIMFVSYYNLLIGFVLCVMYIIMILPFFMDKTNKNNNGKNKKIEGFSTELKDGKKEFDTEVMNLMDILKGNGNKTKEIFNDIKNKESKQKRRQAFEKLESSNGKNNSEKIEQFNEDEIRLEKRKFNPSNEFDNNLKMTREICDDIKKRITYKYENNEYLKKYISTKIQEIIDLLELSKD